LKTVITDGMNDSTVRNIAEIYEALSPLEDVCDNRLIPNSKLVNKINYAEVADSGRRIGNVGAATATRKKETHVERRMRKMTDQVTTDGTGGRTGKGTLYSVFNKFNTLNIISGGGFKDMYEELKKFTDDTDIDELNLTLCFLQMHFNKIATGTEMLTPEHVNFATELKYLKLIIGLQRKFLHMVWTGPGKPSDWYTEAEAAKFQQSWSDCYSLLKEQWTAAGFSTCQMSHLYETLYEIQITCTLLVPMIKNSKSSQRTCRSLVSS
jgi:hypothetical protein